MSCPWLIGFKYLNRTERQRDCEDGGAAIGKRKVARLPAFLLLGGEIIHSTLTLRADTKQMLRILTRAP